MRTCFVAFCALSLGLCIDDSALAQSSSPGDASTSAATQPADAPPDSAPAPSLGAHDLTPPAIVSAAEATYPSAALAARTEAVVQLEIEIAATGEVTDVVVVSSSVDGQGFAEAAVDALKSSKFEPARAPDGTAIAVRVGYDYHFTLPDEKPRLGTFAGQVRSARSKAVAGAQVRISVSGLTRTASTDGAGRFELTEIPLGQIAVQVSAPQCKPLATRERLDVPYLRVVYMLADSSAVPPVAAGTYDVVVEDQRNAAGQTFDDSARIARMTSPVVAPAAQPLRSIVRVGGPPPFTFRLPPGFKLPPGFRLPPGGFRLPPGGFRLPPGGFRLPPGFKFPPLPPGFKFPPLPPGFMLPPGFKLPPGFPPIPKADPGTSQVQLSGVVSDFASGNGLIIHGAPANEAPQFLEGTRIPSTFHFGGLHGSVPGELVDQVVLYPGNFPVYYGRSIGAVSDLRLKMLAPGQSQGRLDLNLADVSAFEIVPLGPRATIALGGLYSYLDRTLDFAIGDQQTRVGNLPQYQDVQAAFTYHFNERHAVQLVFQGQHDAYTDVLAGKSRPDLRASTYRALLEDRLQVTPQLKLETIAALGADDQLDASSRGQSLNLHARETVYLDPTPGVKITSGVDLYSQIWGGELISLATTANQADVYEGLADRKEISPAAFGQVEWQVTHALSVTPGIRFDYFGLVRQASADPRLNARLQLLTPLALVGGVGVFHQEPTVSQTHPTIGSSGLVPSRATQYTLGLDLTPVTGAAFGVSGFYRDLSHLVVESSDTVNNPIYTSDGLGKIYGIESYARIEVRAFTGSLTYTLAHSERNGAIASTDQTHILSVSGEVRLPSRWTLLARWNFATGMPMERTPGSVLLVDSNTFEASPATSGRYALYHQLDLRIDKSFVFDNWKLTAYLDVRNVYNRANQFSVLSYNYDFSRSTYRSALPIMTILGVRAEY